MILNLMRAEELDEEYLIKRTLLEFQSQNESPFLKAEITQLQTTLNQITFDDKPTAKANYL